MDAALMLGGLVFGSLGIAFFIYGKKTSRIAFMIIGASMAALPYFARQSVWLYGIGAVLALALYILRDF